MRFYKFNLSQSAFEAAERLWCDIKIKLNGTKSHYLQLFSQNLLRFKHTFPTTNIYNHEHIFFVFLHKVYSVIE